MTTQAIVSSYNVSLGDMVNYLFTVLDSRPDSVRVVAHSDAKNYDLQWQFRGRTQKAHFVLDSSSQPSSIRDLIVKDSEEYILRPIQSHPDGSQHFDLLRNMG